MSRKAEFYRNLPRMTSAILETLDDLMRSFRVFTCYRVSDVWRVIE